MPSTIGRGLDKIDRRVLRVLHADGRSSNRQRAEEAHLPPTVVLDHIERPTRQVYIRSSGARLDPLELGAGLLARRDRARPHRFTM